MIRLGKLTDYGIVLMSHLARSQEQHLHKARDLACESHLPLPTVCKLLKELLQNGLLISNRGARGGYSLAKPAQEISVAEIITALEGPIAWTECSTDQPGMCDLESFCLIKSNQRVISQAVRGALENVMLSDLVRPMELVTVKNARGNLITSIGLVPGRMQ